MTRRGALTLASGLAVYALAWGTGSRVLYPVAVGLVLAPLLASVWVRLALRPEALSWGSRRREHVEGDDLQIEIEVQLGAGLLPPPSVLLVERISRLGTRSTALERDRGRLSARYVLRAVPRGRYMLREARALVEDPFGLARTEVELSADAALLVYPRLADLGVLFSDRGPGPSQGARVLLHRPAGFDVHGVREYERGDTLRRVHWPSTAKRGRLMIRELEDSSQDEVAVLLDASAASAGAAPDSSFDAQVRAAGSLLKAHAERGRKALLAVNGNTLEIARVGGGDGEWKAALELLAAAEPGGRLQPSSALGEGSPPSRALEAVVVTAQLSPGLVDRLIQRSALQRRVSVVYVDSRSYAAAGSRQVEPALLRLQAAGIPIAVLRRGDDLRAVLGATPRRAVAHG